MQEKEIMNELYYAPMVTTGIVGLSMISKKLLKEKLIDATNFKEAV